MHYHKSTQKKHTHTHTHTKQLQPSNFLTTLGDAVYWCHNRHIAMHHIDNGKQMFVVVTYLPAYVYF